MHSDEIKKYKLERKNIFYGYCIKGMFSLGGIIATSGMSCIINDIPKETIIEIFSDETLIVTSTVCVISIIKTFPITKNIYKTRIKKRKKVE